MNTRTGEKLWLLSASVLVAAVTLRYLLAFGDTPLLSPDSVSYVSAARNLAAGRGPVLFDGSVMVNWPPLYPTILAVFTYLGCFVSASMGQGQGLN